MENNEPMMDAVVIGTDLDGVEEAGRVLVALAGSIGDILRAMHAASKPGQLPEADVQQVAASTEKALHIGAVACRFMADIFRGEEHGAATDG